MVANGKKWPCVISFGFWSLAFGFPLVRGRSARGRRDSAAGAGYMHSTSINEFRCVMLTSKRAIAIANLQHITAGMDIS